MNNLARGRSESLNKTITELMDFLDDNSRRPNTNKRDFLHRKLADLAVRFFRLGFRDGHRSSFQEFKKTGKVPRRIQKFVIRDFFKGQKRFVEIKSGVFTLTIKRG
jgi:hypothetical protein